MSHWLIVPILLPLLTCLGLLLLPREQHRLTELISLLSAAALIVVSIVLLRQANTGQIEVYALGEWRAPVGIVLVLDRLSALMLLLSSTLAFFSIVYGIGNDEKYRSNHYHSLVHCLLLGVNGAFLTGDLFNLFVFFEILLLASYALLLHGNGPNRIKAGLHYVVLNLVGSGFFLIAVAMLYGLTGTLNMAHMAQRVMEITADDAPIAAAAAVILMLVFSLKAALVPLYFWLPKAYASASAPVAALFMILTKVGVYAIIRVFILIFGNGAWDVANVAIPWVFPLALLTLVLSFAGVLAAKTLKEQLAYLVIVSVGTLLAGFALNSEVALAATLFYLLHSTWICAALFLIADQIALQRNTFADQIVSGPKLQQPILLGSLFMFAAASIIGMPPLGGFIGKVLMLKAATGDLGIALWSIVLVGSLVVLVALSRTGSTLFWRTSELSAGPTTESQAIESPAIESPEKESPAKMRRGALIAIAGLLMLGLALTVWGDPIQGYVTALAQQMFATKNYIEAVLALPQL